MWTEIIRANYGRDGLRHESDMTDAEWELIEARHCHLWTYMDTRPIASGEVVLNIGQFATVYSTG